MATSPLTPAQRRILRALARARGQTVTREALASAGGARSVRAVDLQISRMRRRLGDAPDAARIESVYGRGYRLRPAGEAAGPEGHGGRDLVILVDSSFRIRGANAAAERALGAPLLGRRCGEALGCRTPDGTPLDGPGCLQRFVIAPDGSVGDVRACVYGEEGPVDVRFQHHPVRTATETLLAIFVNPLTDTVRRPVGTFGPPAGDARPTTVMDLRPSVGQDRAERIPTPGGN